MYLAIWTAFKAAPFNRLSDTTQKFKILLLDKPSLNLETNTSSLPSTSNGVGSGLSQYSVPSNPLIDDLALSISTTFLNVAEQNVPCPVTTPTLALEGSTIKSCIFKIFLDSFTNFSSSSE